MKIKNGSGLLFDEITGFPLGYLMIFPNRGVYSTERKIDGITPAQANENNRLLSLAEIQGLDTCKIGQWGTFYYCNKRVETFSGMIVSEEHLISPNGKSISFKRKGNTYRGRLPKNGECFFVKRVA